MWLCGCVCVRVYVQFPSAWLAVEQISYTMSHVGGFTSPLHHRITEPSSQTKKLNQAKPKPNSANTADWAALISVVRLPGVSLLLVEAGKGTPGSLPVFQGRRKGGKGKSGS